MSLAITTSPPIQHFQIEPNAFFKKYEELKDREEWTIIVDLGEAALISKTLTPKEEATVHARLCSSYYYLGEYAQAETHAQQCRQLSENIDHADLLARSLYLLSAHKRAEAGKMDTGVERTETYSESKRFIQEALSLIPKVDSKYIVAKIHFNAGALEADNPEGNHQQAIKHYEQASKLYEELCENKDYNRTAIRLAKTYLLQDALDKVEQTLDSIKYPIELERTQVFLWRITAELHFARAAANINLALETAQRLGMKRDVEQLKALQTQLP